MAQEDKDYKSTYIELRTLLDAIQMGSLRYCLEVKGKKARVTRMNTVIDELKTIEESIRTRREEQRRAPATVRAAGALAEAAPEGGFEPDAPDENGCPDGYYRCGAACVPYPCPDSDQ
jgi:hypothetical protein